MKIENKESKGAVHAKGTAAKLSPPRIKLLLAVGIRAQKRRFAGEVCCDI